MAPLPAFRRDVVRVRNLSYGEGPRRKLDVYHRRDRPTDGPVVLHLHGGGFHSGNKRREARPLIGNLVGHGIVCASANYRLRPHLDLAVDAVNAGASGVAGIVGRYGYYGDLMPEQPQPPVLVIHGENDPLVVREFVQRMRVGSSYRAEYVELPGGHVGMGGITELAATTG